MTMAVAVKAASTPPPPRCDTSTPPAKPRKWIPEARSAVKSSRPCERSGPSTGNIKQRLSLEEEDIDSQVDKERWRTFCERGAPAPVRRKKSAAASKPAARAPTKQNLGAAHRAARVEAIAAPPSSSTSTGSTQAIADPAPPSTSTGSTPPKQHSAAASSGSAPGTKPNVVATDTAISSLLRSDGKLSAVDATYVLEFFEEICLGTVGELRDVAALQSVQKYLLQQLETWEKKRGAASGAVRSSLGRLLQQAGVAGSSSAGKKSTSRAKDAKVSTADLVSQVIAKSSALVSLEMIPQGIRSKTGAGLPEVRWHIDGRKPLWELLRRWAQEVLRLPDTKIPGGKAGGLASAQAFTLKGVGVLSRDGKQLPLTSQLLDVVDKLAVRNGHRQFQIAWPLQSLPAGWGKKAPAAGSVAAQKGRPCGDKVCESCGDNRFIFRKSGCDDSMRTLLICEMCNEVRGSLFAKRRRTGIE
eukprot:TRINITY_DN46135_c0_g1_i2.p1 TRINITY_DN46135_c0_g1~~TRINITY_DN46135_c0_g1_i2.p1  ORF type:complete len:471 (-),score=68.71 TRINITY_DN46135_c0_g1_i2:386-1798(-)